MVKKKSKEETYSNSESKSCFKIIKFQTEHRRQHNFFHSYAAELANLSKTDSFVSVSCLAKLMISTQNSCLCYKTVKISDH